MGWFSREFKVRLKKGKHKYHPQYSYSFFEDWKSFNKYYAGDASMSGLCGDYEEMVQFLLKMRTYEDVVSYNQKEQSMLDENLNRREGAYSKLPFDVVE